MGSGITVIAYTFYVLAVVLVVLGAAYLLYDGWRRLRRKLWPKPSPVMVRSPNADGLLAIFQTISVGLAAASKVGNFFSEIVAGIFAGLSISAVLVGTLLFFTARGLLQQAPWARWVAGLLLANIALLAALIALKSARRNPKLLILSLPIAGVCGFAVFTLWQGYVP